MIIGADIGGTSTRVGVADLDGRFLAVVRGGPANPNGVGHEPAIAEIRRLTAEALRRASAEADEAPRVTAVVLGLAGVTGIADPIAFGRAALPDDLTGELSEPRIAVVTDLEVAYASATPEPDGYALIAGTGAFAGTIRSGAMVARRDGWGWLLGDDGSGFWLGREAVRVTLAQLDRGDRLGPLPEAVLAQLEPSGNGAANDLIRSCYARPPRQLSEFAPLVAQLVDADPDAAAIADRAAALLAATLGALDPEPGRPIVLAGSVLLTESAAQPTPIGGRLRALLADRMDNPLREAGPGVVGAAWLAHPDRVAGGQPLHTRLLESALEMVRLGP